MKLSEIEAVAIVDAFEKKANFTNEVRYGGERLYSGRQMQEYAKECVRASLKEYVGPYSDKKANSIISRVVK
ncbi:hypothetical protein [Lactococcus lactis]|uniref:hypothetical protein n=1 Tax=Lactococcus lactis TaxID=1358 RepID=UPI00285D1113|nr:hypothetical protein [Lactococcus lactis]MDR7695800.1 hypothetical protein [Lactococcus lactis]